MKAKPILILLAKKMMLFYHAASVRLCDGSTPRVGDRGFAFGRALKLGSDILYVEPDIRRNRPFYF